MTLNVLKFFKSTVNDLLASTLFGEFVLFSFSTFLLQGSRFGVSLIAAKKLGPETWGVWQLLSLIIAYSNIIHLGVTNGMNRNIPLFRGKGDEERVFLIRGVSLGIVLIGVSVAGCAIFIFSLMVDNSQFSTLLKYMILLLAVYQIHYYFQVSLRSYSLFHHMSVQQIFFSVAFIAIVIPMVLSLNLHGYILGQSLASLAAILFILRIHPIRTQPIFKMDEAVHLIKIGLPIMIAGILYMLMMTVDRIIISFYLNMEQLGYYSLFIMVIGSLTLIPMVVAQQIYPRMAEVWGRTSNCGELVKWIRIQLIMCFCMTTPIMIIAYFLFPPFVDHFMNAYSPGITAMKIGIIGPLFLGFSIAFGNFFNTINKQIYSMLIQAFAILLNIGLNILFIRLGLGIKGVAMGTTITFIIQFILMALIGFFLINKLRHEKYLGRMVMESNSLKTI